MLWAKSDLPALLDEKDVQHHVALSDNCEAEAEETITWSKHLMTPDQKNLIIDFCRFYTVDSFITVVLESGQCEVIDDNHEALEFGPSHQSGFRGKRQFFIAIFLIISLVSLAVSLSNHYSSKAEMSQIETTLVENQVQSHNMKSLAHSVEELAHEIDAMHRNLTTRIVFNQKYINMLIDYKLGILAKATEKRLSVKQAMGEWASGNLGSNFNSTFPWVLPNVIGALKQKCYVHPGKKFIRFDYRALIGDPKLQVYEASAFTLYLNKNKGGLNRTCIAEYDGPLFAIDDGHCMYPVFKTRKDLRIHALFREPDLKCGSQLNDDEKEVWKVKFCLNHTESVAQIYYTHNESVIYCPSMKVYLPGTSVYVECPDFPVSLPFAIDFVVGGITHQNSTVQVDTQTQLSSRNLFKAHLTLDPFNGADHFKHIRGLEQAVKEIDAADEQVKRNREKIEALDVSWFAKAWDYLQTIPGHLGEYFLHYTTGFLGVVLLILMLPRMMACLKRRRYRRTRTRDPDYEMREL